MKKEMSKIQVIEMAIRHLQDIYNVLEEDERRIFEIGELCGKLSMLDEEGDDDVQN